MNKISKRVFRRPDDFRNLAIVLLRAYAPDVYTYGVLASTFKISRQRAEEIFRIHRDSFGNLNQISEESLDQIKLWITLNNVKVK